MPATTISNPTQKSAKIPPAAPTQAAEPNLPEKNVAAPGLHQELAQKYEALLQLFAAADKDNVCIAYSGGVDSTLLLKAAVEACSHPVLAVILETQLHPHSDTEIAYERATGLGAQCEIIRIDEFQNQELLNNPPNRCYLCKRFLFTSLQSLARKKGFHALFDGTNKDDENEYRPGLTALRELGIRSPLQELAFTKKEVRALSAVLGLPTSSLPSTPCLATRLPYGVQLDHALLQRLHEGERFLRSLDFFNVRLRFHDPILRIEIDCESFPALISNRETILSRLKQLGFLYVTLDLEGFRSGSMDLLLTDSIKTQPSSQNKF